MLLVIFLSVKESLQNHMLYFDQLSIQTTPCITISNLWHKNSLTRKTNVKCLGEFFWNYIIQWIALHILVTFHLFFLIARELSKSHAMLLVFWIFIHRHLQQRHSWIKISFEWIFRLLFVLAEIQGTMLSYIEYTYNTCSIRQRLLNREIPVLEYI